VGFAIKGGFLPFHTWLPVADSTGPSHVAGVMSGVIVKLGIFGILRIVSYMPFDLFIIGEIILSLSVLTALYGIINAAVKYDFNRSLAYCTMENIGIIGMGIGLGVMGMGSNQPLLILLGFSGALLHVLNHSLFKSLLFFSTGSVYQQTRTRSIEKLGGLIKSMPVTAVFFLIGAMAIGGLPPFNGFVSEFLIYSGLFKSLFAIKGISNVILIVLSIAGLVLVGGISIVTFTKLFGVIFLGKARHTFKQTPKETGFIMHLPQYLIAGVILTVALFPRFYLQQSVKIIDTTINSGISIEAGRLSSTYTSLEHVGRISLFFIGFVLGLFALRTFFLKKRPKSVQETWACAYSSPVLKAQYSGRSYTRNFGILFGSLIKERRSFNEIPKGKIYPHSRKFSTSYFDFFELYLVTPILKRISWVINYFQFIQNGRIQSYLIYSLVFIVIVFIGTAIGLIK
jgi:formate hydrogenlyase subunit 3/multisubunit Na+/H+ antiporter MnhD subunit